MKRHLLLAGAVGFLWMSCATAQFGGITIPELPEPVYTIWGIPLQEGTIDAVVIAHPETLGDAHELARRLDFKPRIFPFIETANGENDGQAGLRDMLDSRPDVLLTSDQILVRLSGDSLEALLRCLDNGTGLVISRYGYPLAPELRDLLDGLEPATERESILAGIGESISPEWRDGLEWVRLLESDGLRIVELDYGDPAPTSHFLLPWLRNPLMAEKQYWENYLSLVARTVRWAAGWTPDTWITRVELQEPPMPEESEIPPDLPEEFIRNIQESAARGHYRLLTIQLNEPAPIAYRVVGQLRQPGRDRVETIEYENRRIEEGDQRYTFDLALGPGTYYFDVWLYDRRDRVVAWHSEPLIVHGWPQIRDLAFSTTVLWPHDTLDTTVTVETPFSGDTPVTVYVRAFDPLNRLVGEGVSQAPEGGGPATVRLAFADLMTPTVRIEAYAMQSGRAQPTLWDMRSAAYAYGYLPVRRRDSSKPMNVFVRLDGLAEYNQREHLDSLYARGVDGIYTPYSNEAAFYLAQTNLRPIFELTGLQPETVIDDVVRIPSFADNNYLESTVAALQDQAQRIWSADATLFSLGEGNAITQDDLNLCQSRESLNGYRHMLESVYGDIGTLNRAWGTQFGDWRDVTPAPPEAARVLEAYAPWVSFRLFMDQQFAQFHRSCAEAIRPSRPGDRVGFVAAPDSISPYRGYDWAALAKSLDLLIVPPRRFVVEQIGPSDESFRALAFGHGDMTPSVDEARWMPWHAALHGFNGIWWADDAEKGIMTSGTDGRPHPLFETLTAEVDRVNRTLGYAARHGKREYAHIAVYASQASHYLDHLINSSSSEPALSRWTALLSRMGYAYEVISPADIQWNGLDSYDALVLPECRALTDDEIEAFRKFIQNDGKVIADILPGSHTEHGLSRSQPPLAALFDIVTDGEADVPIHRISPAVDMAAELMNILGEVHVVPFARIEERNAPLFQGESKKIHFGEAIVYAFLRDPNAEGGTTQVSIELPEADTVYDALEGNRIRRPGRIRTRMEPGNARVYVALPYEVTDIDVVAPQEVAAGRRLAVQISLDTRGGPPGPHPLVVELIPYGQEPLRHYTQHIVCEEGESRIYFPLAMNEPVGRYTLRVRDSLSGVQTEHPITIVPAS